MNNRTDLVGKTISGIIAAPGTGDGPVSIWMLQFTDGTHVEFVSPSARRALDRFSGARRARGKTRREHLGQAANPDLQLALNVA